MEPTSPSSSSSPSPPEVAGPSSSSSSSLTQPEQRTKLFVGGISSDTQEKDLEEHFRAFGELKQVMVLRDRVTGIGRGFGFVLFAHSEGAETALKNPKHVILRRTVGGPPPSLFFSFTFLPRNTFQSEHKKMIFLL